MMSAAETPKPPEQDTLQPDSRGVCAVGGAGPDKRIGEILDNVKSIRTALPVISGEMPVLVIEEIADTVKDILSVVKGRAEVEIIEAPLLVSYPKSGKKTLTAGTTTINIKGRVVRLADGATDDLYSPRAFEMCRSLLIFTDHTVDVRVMNGGDVVLMSSFFTGSQQLLNLGEFDSVEIEATASTEFYIAMSEDPDGAPSTVQVTELDAVPKPTGGTRATDSATTAVGSFTEIVSHTPEDGVTFNLSKIIATWSGSDEQAVRVKLDTEIIAMYHASDYVMDWFPSEMSLVGDGTKKVSIEAEAVAVVATVTGFIAGEET
jgi:hypothetical protein